MSTNYDLYGREHKSLDGYWSVKIFDFMVNLYEIFFLLRFFISFEYYFNVNVARIIVQVKQNARTINNNLVQSSINFVIDGFKRLP